MSSLQEGPAIFENIHPLAQEVFYLVNDYRENLGLKRLKFHPEAYQIAQTHVVDMADEKVDFGHKGFFKRAKKLRERFSARYSGENIARNNAEKPAAFALQQWLNSSGHRALIEESRYNHTGVAAVPGKRGTWYFTQLFLRIG